MASSFLNKNFDYTQTLIKNNPQNEDALIADFNKLILETKNNSRFVRGATFRDTDSIPNIKIMNNFQRYGANNEELPIFIPTTVPQYDQNIGLISPPTTVASPASTPDTVAIPASTPTTVASFTSPATAASPATVATPASTVATPATPASTVASPATPASTVATPASTAATPASTVATPASPATPTTVASPAPANNTTQSFRNRETFQNYFNDFIKGGFKEYYHI
jgi:hypothetical protein